MNKRVKQEPNKKAKSDKSVKEEPDEMDVSDMILTAVKLENSKRKNAGHIANGSKRQRRKGPSISMMVCGIIIISDRLLVPIYFRTPFHPLMAPECRHPR